MYMSEIFHIFLDELSDLFLYRFLKFCQLIIKINLLGVSSNKHLIYQFIDTKNTYLESIYY